MSTLTPAPDWLIEKPIAHRGLHDLSQGRAENSKGAFQAAIDAGYAIEMDLRWSKSREPIVFHDDTLERLAGDEGAARDYTIEELAEFRLLDTDDTIQTLKQQLSFIDGRVPLVIEVKSVPEEDAEAFVGSIATALDGYQGLYAIMSFGHHICMHFSKMMPDIPRGLTAEGDAEKTDIHLRAMHDFDLQFVSYDVDELPHPFVDQMRAEGLPVITWTVDSEEKMARTYAHADQITFEGFLPDPNARRTADG